MHMRIIIAVVVLILVGIGGLLFYSPVTRQDQNTVTFSPEEGQALNNDVGAALRARILKESKSMETATLKHSILQAVAALKKSSTDEPLKLQTALYLTEYVSRVPHDQDIDALSEDLVILFGPCWGVPEGQCRE